MSVWHITEGPSLGPRTLDEEKAFKTADSLFRGAVISVLGENIVDTYLRLTSGKEIWDTLQANYGVSDAGSELYLMEQYYDYKMVDDRSVVEQAHEIHTLAKELDNFNCSLPDKFVAGGIIAKLPPSWRNFATSLKHKRQEFTVVNLIGSLDVEEKARAKDTRGHGNEGGSSAHVVQKKNFKSRTRENRRLNLSQSLSRLPTSRRRTTTGNAMCAVVLSIMLRTARTVRISSSTGRRCLQMLLLAMLRREHQGMVIMLLFFQFVIYQIGGLTPGLIYMYVLIFLCFLFIRSQGLDPC